MTAGPDEVREPGPSQTFEQAFSRLNHWLRQVQARSIEETHDAIARILERFEPNECAAFVKTQDLLPLKVIPV